ncbi:MAG TPA: cytochrome c [Rhizomicrobium sp.]|nr:cytochrome c [Rhizomicrobium sp.]
MAQRHFPAITRNRLIYAGLGGGVVAIFVVIWLFVFGGAYGIAADEPHTTPVFWVLNHVRDSSIAARAKGIAVPGDLSDPTRISAGAGLYNEMCTACHLAPGMQPTEMSQGLYPKAPEFSRGNDLSSAEKFWVIKHGIKMTAMPAWGITHNDTLIWDMVAFLNKLPSLTPAQYQAAVKSAPADHDEMMKDMQPDGDGHTGHSH